MTAALHIWPLDATEAIAIQQDLRSRVCLDDAPPIQAVKIIAGIDLSHKGDLSRCAIVLFKAEDLTHPTHSMTYDRPLTFPYIPGLLSFREIPVILEAMKRLPVKPDLLMVDGQGIAHPRRLGIASHLGVLTDIPAIGVAKSRLCGRHAEPDNVRGATTDLTDKGERIGIVLRSKVNCNPLYISPGHRMNFSAALDWTMKSLTRYRLPEVTRLADKLSKLANDTAASIKI
jgi:deoxyribonuclease V